MSTFACHCGGTITGTSAPDPARGDVPTWTFVCDDHRGGGARTLLYVEVSGIPADEPAIMLTMKDPIDRNEKWFIDNPTPDRANITSTLIL
jgi:hypothetical protein